MRNFNFYSIRFRIFLILSFFIGWTALLTSVALSLPMDNIEQWVWSHSLEWGYYKHPPLPTWLLSLVLQMTGPSGFTSVMLGAICTLGAVLIFTNLIRQIQGPQNAFIALLAGLCITFYNGRLYYYNHNVLLMLWVALSAQCLWSIVKTGQLRWWIGLGITAGLGMLSKYQYLLVLLPTAWLIWKLEPWKDRRQLQGFTSSILIAIMIFMPHLMWLLHQDARFSPIGYALQTSGLTFLHIGYVTRRIHSGIWLIDLLFNRCLPAILLLLWFKRKSLPIGPVNQDDQPPAKVSGNDFLWWWGVLPPLSITVLGLVLGMDLQLQWGTAFAIWLIPVFMQVLRLQERLIEGPQLRSILGMFILIQGLLMLYSYESSAFGCCSKHNLWRMFDSPQLVKELDQSVRASIGGKFTIIVGPTTVAGAVSMALPDHPKVLIDNNLKISPWIHPDELKKPGVIELWPPGEGPQDQLRLPSGWGWRPYQPST